MKEVWEKWTDISLVQRIVIGLSIGVILAMLVPGIPGISILGNVFVGALKGIAPLLVFFLVMSSLCNARQSHGGVIRTVIVLYMFSTVLAAVIAVFASIIFRWRWCLWMHPWKHRRRPAVLSKCWGLC